jgi:transcriptional regulator with GAF, ATPase, and Fis domain
MQSAALHVTSPILRAEHLTALHSSVPPPSRAEQTKPRIPAVEPTTTEVAHASLEQRLDEFERSRILEALAKHAGNQSRAATELGLPRTTLQSKLKRLEMITSAGGREVPKSRH